MLTDMQIPIVPVSDGTTQRLIANIQENTVANKDYATGEQFILNGVLYEVTKTGSPAIAQGATIDIANDCEVSPTITQQMMPKTGDVYVGNYMTTTFRNGTTGTWIQSDEITIPTKSGYTFCGFSFIYLGASMSGFAPKGESGATSVKYISAYCLANFTASSVTLYPIYRKN